MNRKKLHMTTPLTVLCTVQCAEQMFFKIKIFSSFKSYVRRKWSYSCTTEKLSFRQNGVLHKKRHSVSPPKRAWRSAMSFGSNRNVQYKIVLYSTSAFRHPCDSTCLTVKETYRLCLSNNILAPS